MSSGGRTLSFGWIQDAGEWAGSGPFPRLELGVSNVCSPPSSSRSQRTAYRSDQERAAYSPDYREPLSMTCDPKAPVLHTTGGRYVAAIEGVWVADLQDRQRPDIPRRQALEAGTVVSLTGTMLPRAGLVPQNHQHQLCLSRLHTTRGGAPPLSTAQNHSHSMVPGGFDVMS